MPIGIRAEQRGRHLITQGTLLDAQATTTNGTWLPLNGESPFSIMVEGTFDGTVHVLVSNSEAKPADSDNARPQIGPDFTGPGVLNQDRPYRWLKARVSAISSGAVSVYVTAQRENTPRG